MSARGFTLVEISIVVALVAVLMAVATPSYRAYVLRAHRVEAIARMLRVAQCQERARARSGTYDPAQCLPGVLDTYQFAYAEDTGPQAWTLQARPLEAQIADPCGVLSLDHSGARRAQGDGWTCWSGR